MSFLDIVKSFIPLLAILGLLFGVLILVRKYSFSLNSKKSRIFNVDVIYNQLILPKKYLSIVRVQDKVLVLGISENNITLLKELDYHFAEEEGHVQNTGVKQSFLDILRQNLGSQ